MKRPKPLYIITTARKRDSLDWEGEVAHFCITKDPDNSVCPFIVDSWNNLYKYVDVRGAFFIFDEQRVVGSGAWVKAFLKVCKSNRWILLSATPGDTWMDYIPVFIANGFYKNRTEFISKHVVFSRFAKYPKVERYINEETLNRLKARIIVEMPFERSTESHVIKEKCSFDRMAFMRIYRGRWNPFKEQPIMQAGEWCYLMRKVVNQDMDRLNRCIQIYDEQRRIIIFYNFDYELEILKDGFEEYLFGRDVQVAEYNGHRHDAVPDGDSWVYLVQYQAASEAWNCIATDTIIFYSLNYSYKIMEQAAGRINRMNTPYHHLYYYLLYSDSTIDKSILTALKNKKDFNAGRMYRRLYG